MFHLFNKVYLEFDHNLSVYTSRIVFSDEYASTCDSDTGKIQYYYSKSPALSIGKKRDFKTYVEFFERCAEINCTDNSPLVIYCDKQSFYTLFIAWHKILFDDCTANSLHTIWRSFLEKERYLDAITTNSAHVHSEYFDELLADQVGFNDCFSSVKVSANPEFVKSILNDLGIEYVLTSYMYSKKDAFLEILQSKFLLLIRRALQGELYELKTEIVMHSRNSKFKRLLGLSTDASLRDIFDLDLFKFFADEIYWKNSKMVPSGIDSAVDFTAISQETVNQIKNAVNFLRVDYGELNATSTGVSKFEWMEYLVDNYISKDELDAMLLSESLAAIELSDLSDINHLNVLFIDWALAKYRTGDSESLVDYVLNV